MSYSQFLEITTILSGLSTPLIGFIAAYVAWQQWKTSHQKLMLDLYDRRLKIYQEVVKVLSIVSREADISYEELASFRASVAEADFIFGHDILSFIDEIYSRGIRLHGANESINDANKLNRPDYDRKKDIEEKHRELRWLVSQLEKVKDNFSNYMAIRGRVK